MANIASTTNTTPFVYPSTTLLDRDPTTGYLYCMVKESTANNYTVYRSTNLGVSWAAWSTLVRANIVEIGSIFVSGGSGGPYVWWVYRTNESSEDRIWFQRCNNGAWGGEVLVSNVTNGGVAGAAFQGLDLHVVGQADGSAWVAIAVGFTLGANHGARLFGVTITPGGATAYANQSIIAGTTYWLYPGSGRITPSLDIEHIGDARSAPSTPNLWLAFGRTRLNMVKCAWNYAGWTGPTTATVLQTTITAQDWTSARWNGNEFYVLAYGVSTTDTINLYERNRANTTTTVRTTPSHPTGVIRTAALSYNAVTRDARVYAVGTSSAALYYIDFIRDTGLWSAWTAVSGPGAVLGITNHGVRRGSWGNSKYDVYSAVSGAPNTLPHTMQSLSYAPNTPTWNFSAGTYQNSGAADVAASLVLDWDFTDPDTSDTQSAFALSRQVGAGALEYWNVAGAAWSGTEVQNTSGTSALTLTATQWSLDGLANGASDPAHTYKVKVWDSASTASGYSTALILTPSAKVNPTITVPSAAAVLAVDHVTTTWTASEQTQYRITLTTNPGGVLMYDSLWITSTLKTVTVPYVLDDQTGWTLALQIKNNEGLISNTVTVNFTVDYIEPPAPVTTTTPDPADGVNSVVVTNATAIGTQPAMSSQDIYRRIVGTYSVAMNANPYFEVNSTGWTAVGGTIARSTAQHHEGVASLLVTPTGGIADSYGESTAKYAVTQGVAYTATAWVRPTTANKPIALWIRWYTATPTFVSSTLITAAAVATGWQLLQVTGMPPPTATQASIAVGLTSTAAATDTAYADEVLLTLADTSTPVRIATGLASGASYDDWQAVSGVAYEYRARAFGVNGTSIFGPWRP